VASATLDFDFEEAVKLVASSNRGLNQADAEDAVQTAVAEGLERGWALTRANVIACAKLRGIDAYRRRERRNLSLDSFRENTEDHAPVELAVEETDFDAHAELSAARDNPVLAVRISTDRRVRWSRDLIIKAIRAFIREEGHRPSHKDLLNDPRLPVISVIERHFGDFPAALEAAGSSINEPTKHHPGSVPIWPKPRCEEAVRTWAAEHGRPPTYDDARFDRSLPHPSTIRASYGGWLALREAAGMPSTYETRKGTWPRQRALEALRGHVAEHGHLPALDDFCTYGLPSRCTVKRLFGTSALARLMAIATEAVSG